jgi:SagB-type dehydrogenase family enzyme
MKGSGLLVLDAVVNLALGLLLLLIPTRLAVLLGIPLSDGLFIASILGAVLMGIGVALLLESFRPSLGLAGLGLAGAITINMFAAGVLAAWLLSGTLPASSVAYTLLWLLAILVLGISLVELFTLLREKQTPGESATKLRLWVVAGIVLVAFIMGATVFTRLSKSRQRLSEPIGARVVLPEIVNHHDTSVEQALLGRRSVREYLQEPLELNEISQLLWAAQGITRPGGYRTAPSAGALYPLEIYVVAGNVNDLPDGIYHYQPQGHELIKMIEGDHRSALSVAAIGQDSVKDAAAVLVVSAVPERTTVKYGNRGIRYVQMEVGSVAQNVYLQSVPLNLGTVFIGAFYDEEVQQVLNLDDGEVPLCLMPIGRPRAG